MTTFQYQSVNWRIAANSRACDPERTSASVGVIFSGPYSFELIPFSGYFAQHHVDTLNPALSPVQFLASRFPGKVEQEYRSHLGNFQISGMTGYAHLHLTWYSSGANSTSCRLQPIGTLSGGQKSRVAFALLSLQKPHILLLDEVKFQNSCGNLSYLLCT